MTPHGSDFAGAAAPTFTHIEDRVFRIAAGFARCEPEGTAAELRALGIDSLAVISMIMALEEEFGIELPDEMLTDEHFRSIETVIQAVSGLILPAS